MKKKIVAFVPIKQISMRLRDKNFRLLGDLPLFMHIINTLSSSPLLDEVYIFSNADFSSYKVPSNISILRRPKILDEEATMGIEIYDAFVKIVDADLYVLCHSTSPFLSIDSIHLGLNAVLNNKFDSAFTVSKHDVFAWYLGMPINYNLNNVPRTQLLEPILLETSGLYIFTKRLVLENKRRIGFKPYFIEVLGKEAIDIDYEDDFILASLFVSKK